MRQTAREVAIQAFAKYDADGSGSIDKSELFAAIVDTGHVLPLNGTEAEKAQFLERSFVKADADGNGVVDVEEFVNFYTATMLAHKAFAKYDTDGSGTIDKDELFAVMLDLGQVVPADGTAEQKEAFLETAFTLADADGDRARPPRPNPIPEPQPKPEPDPGNGTVDVDEFVDFYTTMLLAMDMQDAARHAFDKYDVDESNTIDKIELFRALIDFELVPGMSLKDKRLFLEEAFVHADANGDGSIDFPEFCAYYVDLYAQSRSDDVVRKRRAKARRLRQERALRQQGYRQADSILGAIRQGDLVLVRATWLLARAGYVCIRKDRGLGRTVFNWRLQPAGATFDQRFAPLPSRQELERDCPDAFVPAAEIDAGYETVRATLARLATDGCYLPSTLDDADSLPVVLISHCWRTDAHADPAGATLRQVAAQLARDMPQYQGWGLNEVGVFIDWCSLYQETADTPLSDEQRHLTTRALNQMGLWYSHRRTTVYFTRGEEGEDGAPPISPPREQRGWPHMEEAVCNLFKVPHMTQAANQPFMLPSGVAITAWKNVVDLGIESNPATAGTHLHATPPVAASAFADQINSKRLLRDSDRPLLVRIYRKVLEDGFNGLEKLTYTKLEWDDAELATAASTLKEESCPQVTELDLSWNHFTGTGLIALGEAVSSGSLHTLKTLNLSNCMRLTTLPPSLAELAELESLDLSGCVGLSELPAEFTKLVSLRTINVTNCHLLRGSGFEKRLPKATKIICDDRDDDNDE